MEKVNEVGAELTQPLLVAVGEKNVSVSRYPVTPTLSVAVNERIETAGKTEVGGRENDVTTGFVVSDVDVEEVVIVTFATRGTEMFPAASFAYPQSENEPVDDAYAYVVVGEFVHNGDERLGVLHPAFTKYPVTPTLSVAVNDVIATICAADETVDGTTNDVTTGFVVSDVDVAFEVIPTDALRYRETFPAASLAQA